MSIDQMANAIFDIMIIKRLSVWNVYKRKKKENVLLWYFRLWFSEYTLYWNHWKPDANSTVHFSIIFT